LLRLIYRGSEFGSQGVTMGLLGLSALVTAAGATVHPGLHAIERPDITFRGCLWGAAATVAAGPFLVSRFGVEGAAWTSLVGAIVSMVGVTVPFCRLTRDSDVKEEGLP
jgi:O-antigen/teichoic acid export membrane protein